MVRLTVVCIYRQEKAKGIEKIPLYVVAEYMNEKMGDYDESHTHYSRTAGGDFDAEFRGAVEYQWADENSVDVMQPCSYLPTMGYTLQSCDFKAIPDGDNFVEIDEDAPESDTYMSALPTRNVARSIKSFYPKDNCVADFYENRLNNKCRKELGKLTERELGFNIDERKDLQGQYVIVKTSKHISRFDITRHTEGKGLLCEVDYIDEPSDITIFVDVKDKIGRTLSKVDPTINCGKRLFLLPLNSIPKRIGYEVRDVDGMLIQKSTDTTFIGGFSITTHISQSKNVIVTDGKGNKRSLTINVGQEEESRKKTVEDVDGVIWQKIADHSSKIQQEWNERNLNFIFFDGSRNGGDFDKNKAKAKATILDILRKSTKEILIADPYFDCDALIDFLYEADRGNTSIKILRDKDHLSKATAHDLAMAVEKYCEDFETKKLECKALMGNTALHDRFILLDNCGWMIGCSLNSFGKSATTITRIPKDSLPRMRENFMKWWNDSATTKDIATVDAQIKEQNKYDKFISHLKSAIKELISNG